MLGKISGDLIPFGSVFRGVGRVVGRLLHLRIGKDEQGEQSERDVEAAAGVDGNGEQERLLVETDSGDDSEEDDDENAPARAPKKKKYATEPRVVRTAAKRRATLAASHSVPTASSSTTNPGARGQGGVARMSGEEGARQASEMGRKHRPRVAGQGENLPLDALRFLSDWTAVLEERGTVPGLFFLPVFCFVFVRCEVWACVDGFCFFLLVCVIFRNEFGRDDWVLGGI